MPYITLSSGLTIQVPTRGTTNWDETLRTETFQKISEHDHTGGGRGTQIGTGAIVDDSITDAKVRLRNDNYLRARNAASSADIDIIKVDDNDEIILEDFKGGGSFALTNNQSSAADITGMSVDIADNTYGALINYYIRREGTADLHEKGTISIHYNESDFDFSVERTPDPAGITFSVTAAGQVQYTSTDNSGSTADNIYWSMTKLGAE